MRSSKLIKIILAVILALLTLSNSGCGGGSSEPYPYPVLGEAGDPDFQFSSSLDDGDLNYHFYVKIQTVFDKLQLGGGDWHMYVLKPDASGEAIPNITGFANGNFIEFRTGLANGSYLLEFYLINDSSVRINQALAASTYREVVNNNLYIGVTVTNGVVNRFYTKQVTGISGTDWPGRDGDKFFRYDYDLTLRTYTIYIRNNQDLHSSNFALIADWMPGGFSSLPGVPMTRINDNWFQSTIQNVPDGIHRFTLIGISGLQPTGFLDTTSSEFDQIVDGLHQFQASFTGGVVTHSSISLFNPFTVQLRPVVRVAPGHKYYFHVLASYNGVTQFTYDVTTKVTRWSSSSLLAGEVNSNGLFTASGVSTTAVTAVFGSNSKFATSAVTVANTNVIALVVTGPVSLAVSGQANMMATALSDDSSEEDVTTTDSVWQSSAPNVAAITSLGVVSGISEGASDITMQYHGVTSLPFRLSVGHSTQTPSIVLSADPTPITGGGTTDLIVSFSDNNVHDWSYTISDITLATAEKVGNNVIRVTGIGGSNEGGIVRFTVFSGTQSSNKVDVVVYGHHGIIKGRMYILAADADPTILAGWGAVTFRADIFNWTAKPSYTLSINSGANSVSYYVMDPPDPIVLSKDTVVKWNVEKGGLWYPNSGTNEGDAYDNGQGGKYFINTAK